VGCFAVILYRRQKRLWIGGLTVALVVVIGLSFAVVWPSKGLSSSWSSGFIGFPQDMGGVLTTRTLTQNFSVAPGSFLSVEVPLGDVLVLPGTGTEVDVRTVVSAQGTSAANAKQNAQSVQWERATPNAQEIDLSLDSTLPNALRGSRTVITIPSKMQISLTDHLGNVTSSGTFEALSVLDNMGNITNRGNVLGELDLQSDLGDILQEGSVGSQTVIQDHLGNIQVIVPSRQTLQIDATTDMGSVYSRLPVLGGTVTDKGLHGQIGRGRLSGTVQITDNLGDITFEGANTP